MKSFLSVMAVLSAVIAGCESSEGFKNDSTLEKETKALADFNLDYNKIEVAQSSSEQNQSGLNRNLVSLSDCTTKYNNNLEAVTRITFYNSTARSIKGIEIVDKPGGEMLQKIKIVIPPHSKKRIVTNNLTCKSLVVGIFYANGEYKEIPENSNASLKARLNLGLEPGRPTEYRKE